MHSPEVRLEPRPQPVRQFLRDFWASRPLIAALGRQDFFVKYRRASFGMLWAVGIPLIQTTAITAVLGNVLRFNVGSSYAIFVLSGIVPWSFFNSTVLSGSTSIVDMSGMASKIYFPRMVMPLTRVVSGYYQLGVSAIVLLIAAVVVPLLEPIWNPGAVSRPAAELIGWHMLWIIPGCALLIALGAGFSMVLSALHVYFRDVRFILQAIMLVWFYGTPIFYPITKLGNGRTHDIVQLNPLTGALELFRMSTGVGRAGLNPEPVQVIGTSVAWAVGLITLAVYLHHRYDRLFTDLL